MGAKMNIAHAVVFFLLLITISGCNISKDNPQLRQNNTQIANPSATKCIQDGYQYNITTNPDGSQAGICIISDKVECDGWAYYREECP